MTFSSITKELFQRLFFHFAPCRFVALPGASLFFIARVQALYYNALTRAYNAHFVYPVNQKRTDSRRSRKRNEKLRTRLGNVFEKNVKT